MIKYWSTKVRLISVTSIAAITLIPAVFWLYLVWTIPKLVNEEYASYSGDTHLKTSLSYCLSGPQRAYAIKSLYASANVSPGGSVGYIGYYDGKDFIRDGNGMPRIATLDSSGKLPNDSDTYKMCVPIKWELSEATP